MWWAVATVLGPSRDPRDLGLLRAQENRKICIYCNKYKFSAFPGPGGASEKRGKFVFIAINTNVPLFPGSPLQGSYAPQARAGPSCGGPLQRYWAPLGTLKTPGCSRGFSQASLFWGALRVPRKTIRVIGRFWFAKL